MKTELNEKRIYVYADEGVDPDSLTHTLAFFGPKAAPLKAQKLILGDWVNSASLLIMPGGADIAYMKKLNGSGNQVIKNYVQNGGIYLGICAGAYYAADYIEFDSGGPREVLGNRELCFFPGKAIGPVKQGAHWVQIAGQKMLLYDGPYFENADQFDQVTVLARYDNHSAAIISTQIGLGSVILSGVHFEFPLEHLSL